MLDPEARDAPAATLGHVAGLGRLGMARNKTQGIICSFTPEMKDVGVDGATFKI